MKQLLLFTALIAVSFTTYAQVGVGTTNPDASAALDIAATDKGILIPRVALTGTADATTVASPATGLMVYNTAAVSDVTVGFYYYNGTAWTKVSGASPKFVDGTNAVDAVYTDGNVGVGIQTPSLPLEVHPYGSDITGTAAITTGSPIVTGTGTNFTTSVMAGQYLLIDKENKKIVSVDSDTQLTMDTNYSVNKTNRTIEKNASFFNGVVGIGSNITNTNAKLTVERLISVSEDPNNGNEGGQLKLMKSHNNSADPNGSWDIDFFTTIATGGILRFIEGGKIHIVIQDDTGRVSIGGELIPTHKLYVNNNNSDGKIAKLRDAPNGVGLEINTASGISGINAKHIQFKGDDADSEIVFTPSTSANAQSTLVLKKNGQVGIGTATPFTPLTVSGKIMSTRQNTVNEGGEFGFTRASDNAPAWSMDVFGTSSTTSTMFRLSDSVNNTTRLNISESGNVGIGIGQNNATSRLQVAGLLPLSSDAAAAAAGLTSGAFYKTSGHATLPDGVVMIKL